MRLFVTSTFCAGLWLCGTAAQACAPPVATDPVTGESCRSGSPEWLRREQADWRARSEGVVIAQVRAGRMLEDNQTEFTLVPIFSLYGEALPENDLTFRWMPGNTCNRFTLKIADRVIVYVGTDRNVVGVTIPEQLQDRPPGFGQRLREIARGMIGPRIRQPNPDLASGSGSGSGFDSSLLTRVHCLTDATNKYV